jgi:hypothetical protein
MNTHYFRHLLIIGLSFQINIQTNIAQTSKIIDGFRNDRYFTAFISGQGTVKDTVIKDHSSYLKGLLKINYEFSKAGHSCFTVFCNYGKAAQDYSFMPDRFTLSIKGGSRNDHLRLRLWEDINMNGVYDGNDEIFVSEPFTLGDSTWHQVSFPISSFTKLEGNGNNQLDLNRIRAWEIAVENHSGEAHSGEMDVDELRLYSTYIKPHSKKASITGTFITLCNTVICRNSKWTQPEWNEQLDKMKKMRLNKLIVQYSIHQNIAWYSPCKLPFIVRSDSSLNKIFTAAKATGIKVWLGLYFDESWNKSDKASANVYSDLLIKQKAAIDELNTLFGKDKAFGGWYIPQEINDLDWQTNDRKTLLFNWLQEIAKYAHSKNPAKPVMISPYFNLWQPADVLEEWYNELLTTAKDIDWVYVQDGIGTTLKGIDVDIPHYYSHIKSACNKHGKKFGAIVESYKQLTGWPIDMGIFTATGASILRVNAQVQEAYHQKPNDIIMFDWNYLPQGEN